MNNDEKILMDELEAKFKALFGDLDADVSAEGQQNSTIILNDENGEEVEFEFIDLIDYQGEEYVVLLPVEDTDDAGEVVILKLDGEDEESESYVSVDDESVLMAVFEIFKEKFKDFFNFVD